MGGASSISIKTGGVLRIENARQRFRNGLYFFILPYRVAGERSPDLTMIIDLLSYCLYGYLIEDRTKARALPKNGSQRAVLRHEVGFLMRNPSILRANPGLV